MKVSINQPFTLVFNCPIADHEKVQVLLRKLNFVETSMLPCKNAPKLIDFEVPVLNIREACLISDAIRRI